MNKYLRSKTEVAAVSPADRWKYYIAREYTTSIEIRENCEPLVAKDFLVDKGVRIEPIWEDAELDEEGMAYKEFLASNELRGWSRQGSAERLIRASDIFKTRGFTLVLKAGFRPIEVQQKLFVDVLNGYRLKYPTMQENKLVEMTRDYVSDPTQLSPPHTVGAAVDVMLRNASGEVVDMGCEVNKGEDVAWADYQGLSPHQTANRKLLRDGMLDVGFAPLGSEWWHFSYGDQIWAAYYEKAFALYGIYE